MSERVLIPDIYREVPPDIGDDLRVAFEAHLSERGDFEASLVDKVLRPLNGLRSVIIGHHELERLHRELGITEEVDEEHVSTLMAHVEERLPETRFETLHPASWPLAAFSPKGGSPSRKTLTIGQSKTVGKERSVSQQAIQDFYELPKMPKNIWTPDTLAGRVAIMGSRNRQTAEIYGYLDILLRTEDSPLPERITLEPVRIDPDAAAHNSA